MPLIKLKLLALLFINFLQIFITVVEKSVKSSAYWGNSINNPVSKNNTSLWICLELHIARFPF